MKDLKNNSIEKFYETAIGKLLNDYYKIEWMRFNMFNLEDIYYNIPMLIFRVEKDYDECICKLKEYVENIQTINSWTIFRFPYSKNKNYILTLDMVRNIYMNQFEKQFNLDLQQILGKEKYEKLCKEAITDIPLLYSSIKEYLVTNNYK
ncbi:hypothetical protein [Eubacterium uniforme]|nr:hypothetical protein [Eubacterium uniforme]